MAALGSRRHADCPEQRSWGGVLKSRFLWLVEHPRISRAAPVVLAVATRYLRWRYARLARAVARDLADYVSAGTHAVTV